MEYSGLIRIREKMFCRTVGHLQATLKVKCASALRGTLKNAFEKVYIIRMNSLQNESDCRFRPCAPAQLLGNHDEDDTRSESARANDPVVSNGRHRPSPAHTLLRSDHLRSKR
jgi:hypothetical protein